MDGGPILVLGASGFLGPHVVAAARATGARVAAASRAPERAPVVAELGAHELHRWDALDDGASETLLDRVSPRAIVLAAALSRAEACEGDPELARALNEDLPGRIAGLARERGLRLVHLSTDLVFGARPPARERYSEADPPSPMHAYGRSKAGGEARVLAADPRALVIRLPLLYGDSFGRGLGATDQVLAALEREGRPLLFTDEWRTPLEAGDAARAVIELLSGDASGILHVAGPVRLSRHELGLELLRARGFAPERVRAGSRAEAALSAPRPGDVSLDSSRARTLLKTPLRAPRAALAVHRAAFLDASEASRHPLATMELDPRYDPHAHEAAVYRVWLDSGAFTPRRMDAERFVIMIPPPNVTGVLHMGHALNGTLQDIVIRFQRMLGKDALWLPGTDHAGIATQAVVEKKLFAEEKKTRQELGREAFVARVWEWKEEHGNIILEQFRRLGSSCDWTRTRFTLEPALSRAVREAFVRLWEKGLVYRGARLVNWDCVLQTAVSDDEVEMVQQRGKLAYLRYPIDGQPGRTITVATTRPETMLGDTGVAVHPDDERYRDLVGQHCIVPFVERRIPIVADETVESKFGTGAVKVTPGHDPADYERGARFRLPIVNLLEKDGTLNANAGPFAGQPREKARAAILKQMEERGLLEKVEDHVHNVPISDRSKSPIEPLVSEQWFVKMRPLAVPAIRAVKDGSLAFKPERWTKVYLDWLENVQDWCISRQLWWGHRIPVFYDEDGVPAATREDVAIGSPHPKTGKPIVRQDEDVLDTWASSWLWPFATLGWPDRTPDLARFYPTQFLSTAREILYLWVARMVMAGYELLDHLPESQRCPFATCYVNATVLDAKGKRMSKSAGNGIDPLDMIEKYGADAVRLSLVLLTREGQDVKLSEDKFEMGRRFTNKVWNAARFALGHLAGASADVSATKSPTVLEDRWILSRLAAVRDEVTAALSDYRFNDAASTLYRFVWNDFCDWYLELVKSRLGEGEPTRAAARATLFRVLRGTLQLLHPFTPFQTEVLWKALHEVAGEKPASLLVVAPWPETSARDEAAEREIGVLQELVSAVRNVRALTTIGDRKPLAAVVSAPRASDRAVLEASERRARALAFLSTLEIHERAERPPASAVGVATGFEVFVPLGEGVDLGELAATFERRSDKLRKALAAADAKLGNEGFLRGADPEVVEAERARRGETQGELELLERNLAGLR